MTRRAAHPLGCECEYCTYRRAKKPWLAGRTCSACKMSSKCAGQGAAVALTDYLVGDKHLERGTRTLVDALASQCRKWAAK